VELRVITDDGRDAKAGEVGEIIARGANIAAGYWKAPDETAERFQCGGFRTGDLGFVDADGYLYVVGRRHDMIKVGAHRIAAREIEDVLHEHPAIFEAAVVGEIHPLLGETPVAHVALRDGSQIDASAVIAACRARLPEHKVPSRVVFHAELPKTPAGKVAKDSLKKESVGSMSSGGG
jgi:long-chain acyl-CoA synthetase